MSIFKDRLVKEWEQHGKIIIAVDFDDTISAWGLNPEHVGDLYDKVLRLVKDAKEVGAYVVIWSACDPDRYQYIADYCAGKGLIIDAVNENPIDLPYGKNKKIYANIYLDDRAGLQEACLILESAMYTMKGKKDTARLNYPGSLG